MRTFETGSLTLERVREYVWELPQEDGMRVPGRVLASERLLEEIADDKSLQQLRNTTHLPGIRNYALALPDAHQGYGFPVGGVAGIDAEDGCLSPGAIGYDINCGVRLLKTNLSYEQIQGHEEQLVDALFADVPTGLGGGGVIEGAPVEEILERGVKWAVDEGHGIESDLRGRGCPAGRRPRGGLEEGKRPRPQPGRQSR